MQGIIGKVISVNQYKPGQPTRYQIEIIKVSKTVSDIEIKDIIAIESQIYMSLMVDDQVFGNIVPKEHTKHDVNFIFTDYPFVLISHEQEQVKNTFEKTCYKIKYKFPAKFYIFLEKTYKNVLLHLDQEASQLYDDEIKGNQYKKPIWEGPKNPEPFLRNWLRLRLFRQLELFGIKKDDIYRVIDSVGIFNIWKYILQNPYRIYAMSIDLCDQIMEIQGREEPRLRNCGKLLRLVHHYHEKCWTFVPLKMIMKKQPDFENLIDLFEDYNLHVDEHRFYSKYSYEAEVYVAEYIKNLLNLGKLEINNEIFDNIDFKTSTENQKNIIKSAISNHVFLISGQPGSGKTTVIKYIIEYLKSNNQDYLIGAFTGKATKRVFDATGYTAYTLDRMISKGIIQDMSSELTLIIDEISMVSTELIYRILMTRKKYITKFILVGDINQLSPMSWGFFMDNILKIVPFEILTQNFRCDSKGEIHPIVANSDRILKSQSLPGCPELVKSNNFKIIQGDMAEIKNCLFQFKEANKTLLDFKILTPFNKYLSGLNNLVREVFLPNEPTQKDCRNKSWYLGSLVKCTKNTYDVKSMSGIKVDIMNGEEGFISEISTDSLIVDFNTLSEIQRRVRFYYRENLEERDCTTRILTDSSAITIHSSQGSEYKYILLYIPKVMIPSFPEHFLNVRLIYTAITRAKKVMYIIGDKSTFWNSTKKLPFKVCDYLKERICPTITSEESDYQDDMIFDYQDYEDDEDIYM